MKMNNKKMMAMAMAALMTTGMVFADNNHKAYETTINGVRYLPVRETMESYGYEVVWNPEIKRIELLKGAGYDAYNLESNTYIKNKMAPQKLQHKIQQHNGKTYISTEDLEKNMNLGDLEEKPQVVETMQTSGLIIDGIEEDGRIRCKLGEGEAYVYVDQATITEYGKEAAYEISKDDIGKELLVTHPSSMTAIYPPQYRATKIEVLPKDVTVYLGETKEVQTGERESVLISNDARGDVIILVNEDTVIENLKGEKIELKDIKSGSKITAYHSIVMMMSLPGQSVGYKLIVEQ